MTTTKKKKEKKQLIYCVWASLLLFLIVPFLENEIQLCIFSYKKYALICFKNDILLSKSVVTYQSLFLIFTFSNPPWIPRARTAGGLDAAGRTQR